MSKPDWLYLASRIEEINELLIRGLSSLVRSMRDAVDATNEFNKVLGKLAIENEKERKRLAKKAK